MGMARVGAVATAVDAAVDASFSVPARAPSHSRTGEGHVRVGRSGAPGRVATAASSAGSVSEGHNNILTTTRKVYN